MSVKFSKRDGLHDSGDCMMNLNILAHAQLIELDIGSECGGHGRCGADQIQLKTEDFSKVNLPTSIEKHHLSAEELGSGVRLACQTFPNQDGLEIVVTVLA